MSENEKVSSKIKRRKWTEEEKSDTLKSCRNACAKCGKKLTMETLTMEHVIPISKGGENVLDNLLVLCKECNLIKSDKFCWPGGYYMALENESKLKKVQKYTEEWVSKNVNIETIKQYPMVAETMGFYVTASMNFRQSKYKYIPRFTYDVFEITEDKVDKVLAGLNLKKRDFYNTLVEKGTFSLIGLKSVVSDEVSAVFTVQCVDNNEDTYIIFISEVYSKSTVSGEIIPAILFNSLSSVWRNNGVAGVVIRTKDEGIAKRLYKRFKCDAIEMEEAGFFGFGEDVNYVKKEEWPYPNNVFAFIFSDSQSARSRAKDIMRDK